MYRMPLVTLFAVILAICFGSSVFALATFENSTTWDDNGNVTAKVKWINDWGIGTNDTPPASFVFQLSKNLCINDDPTVTQEVYNDTNGYWTDWHVDIVNGYIIANSASAYNESVPGTPWQVDYFDMDHNGYFDRLAFHVVSGQNTQIDPEEILSLTFNYMPGQGEVSFLQYPTADYPIPEPGSIVTLASALAAFGFGIRRRSK